MSRLVTLSLVLAGSIALTQSASAQAAPQRLRPNIVYILADDMGYGDIQAYNPESRIPTPNLNRLAQEGMRFTDAHSPSAVCTPTRYATLTGRYCWRSRLKRGVLNGYSEPLIERNRPTVASFLKGAGYHTAAIGKWHLGLGFQREDKEWLWDRPLRYSPVDAGFEHSYVIPASLDFPPYVYIRGHEITGLPDSTQAAQRFPAFLRKGELGADFSMIDCLDRLTEEAVEYIQSRADQSQPFFLYFPLTAPHKPVLPHPRFRGRSELGPYGDFVMQVDATVGQVLSALQDNQLEQNTLVIYTSDNGSFMYRSDAEDVPDHVQDPSVQTYFQGHHTANGSLRGTKADIWEGGHRVPFLARWPKMIEAGTTCSRTICQTDLFATAAAVARAPLPPPTVAAPDSYSLLPLLRGKTASFTRAPVVHHSAAGMFAIRRGPWKLILGNGSGGRAQPKGKRFEGPWQLYNLADDPGEEINRAEQEPAIVQELQRTMLLMLADDRSR